jgi:hypothetical protein
MQLTEQYRPRVWEGVAGQDKVIGEIRKATRRGFGGEAYWLSSASGTGKTTIARLIASEAAYELATQEENGQDIDVDVRRMRAAWSTTVLPSTGSDKTGRAWINPTFAMFLDHQKGGIRPDRSQFSKLALRTASQVKRPTAYRFAGKKTYCVPPLPSRNVKKGRTTAKQHRKP